MEAYSLSIGWASRSITPDRPVQLSGQFYERVSERVRDPVTATALALQAGEGNGTGDEAIIVSCDLVNMPSAIQDAARRAVASRIEAFDTRKLFCAATHTHTGPVMAEGRYPDPGDGVTKPAEYAAFLVERIAEAAVAAWEARAPGGLAWALSHAAVGFNRRLVYRDGTAKMYGSSDTPEFVREEGRNDHGVELLYTFDETGALTGVVANVACPSQVVENKRYVSADYWSEVRRRVAQAHGERVGVLGLCGAAGDQSPRDLVRRGRGEPDFRDESGLVEMGRRIATAIEDGLVRARDRVTREVPFRHTVASIDLPASRITPEDVADAKRAYDELARKSPPDGSVEEGRMRRLKARVLDRFETQPENPTERVEVHALRLGDVALVTNPFELFLDYGLCIKATSRAEQTFIAQLACDSKGYLPTALAVPGGGYGATKLNGPVGPEGGEALVEASVKLINAMWE